MLKPTLFMSFLSFDPREQASDFELKTCSQWKDKSTLGYDSDFHSLVSLQFWRGAAHAHMLPHEACQVGGCLASRGFSVLMLSSNFAQPAWLCLICCPAFGLSFTQSYSPRFALP